MFSKISVIRIATQPAMLMICHDSGSAIATVPTSTLPWTHSAIATAPVPVTSMALSVDRQKLNSVLSRSERVEQPGVLVDRVAHIGVLVAGAREQLHGEDVGVGIDDAPGEHRARLGDLLGAVAHARHEHAQQHEIARRTTR